MDRHLYICGDIHGEIKRLVHDALHRLNHHHYEGCINETLYHGLDIAEIEEVV